MNSETQVAKFDDIEVKRIRLLDEKRTMRMSLSGKPVPDGVFRGKLLIKQQRMAAEFIFLTEEGTECSGLIYGGQTAKRGPEAASTFTMDAYEQDQVITFTSGQRGELRGYGLNLSERPFTDLREFVKRVAGWRKWPFMLTFLIRKKMRRRMQEANAQRLFWAGNEQVMWGCS